MKKKYRKHKFRKRYAICGKEIIKYFTYKPLIIQPKEKKDFIYIGITLLGKTYIHKDIIKWINDIKLWQIQINPQASASLAYLPYHS